jgi:hypothetical protein
LTVRQVAPSQKMLFVRYYTVVELFNQPPE